MIAPGRSLGSLGGAGILIDTNLLVLFAVGTVNRDRIETFRRTRQYMKGDYDLSVRVLGKFNPLYTVAHVLAEVSNLTDLPGPERLLARRVLKEAILCLNEAARAAEDRLYEDFGSSMRRLGSWRERTTAVC